MTSYRKHTPRIAMAAVAAGAALTLAACGGNDDSGSGHGGGHGSSSSAPAAKADKDGKHNAADVAFAQQMIQHHRQAIEMAELVPDRAGSAEVKKLGADIKKAQDPEIETMSGWLKSWGEEVPGDMSGGHGGHDMPGMMSADEMAKLEKSEGAAFDKLFSELMIKHHEGAIEMAETEKKDGAYGPAKKLSDAVIKTQSAEIKVMEKLAD
ncbi:DUF305 domain-containing protein [Streptomyces sp. A7024]|uniref:DUF305 domain-containing protein n=1 Tax=Streptomyces coryli TaxID=1128680 RepID=A0A6G4TXM1_9ACTN|nr:DUF305 domain-containing protein [Streptomyces coryli]NGN64270.1 DUF305 domain-containing protein [Streptomyces coryli]